MSEINYDWVKSQFSKAHVRVGPGEAVLKLLETWEKIDLDPQLAQEAVEIFSQVALGHALVPDSGEETWLPVIPGSVRVGNEVRVKHDAFTGDLGELHNGRRGKVVAIRFGDVIFKSTDNIEPYMDGIHYSPYKLEMRIR